MTYKELIEAQQSALDQSDPAWMVGEQLKDICRREPESAELVEKDLTVKGMGLADCEKKIKAYSDSHRTGRSFCVSPAVAEDIIRKFYGLPERMAGEELKEVTASQPGAFLDLASFL